MRTIYLKVMRNGLIRKVAVDMSYLSAHNKIRLPKYYFEEGLFLSYKKNLKETYIEEYYLTKDKIKKEDNDFYYFDFPFKVEQVFDISI
ncbi:MAG: hypothetical protein MUF28_04000 [Ignavibacterium sp.]|jgi:hypothetical protein|nr:hypothetical protein [Ignavibacterium sp.]